MMGTTAQLVALACHFNAAPSGRLEFAPLLESNSTFQFCEYVQFVQAKTSFFRETSTWEVVASTPNEWLARVSGPGKAAFISHQNGGNPSFPDRLSAGFIGGGGSWRLFTSDGKKTAMWQAGWEVSDKDAPHRRIWRVSYGLIGEAAHVPRPPVRPPETIIPVWLQNLTDILLFAQSKQLTGFSACFERAIRCCSADDPLAIVPHRDLAPDELLGLPAKRLLCACQAAGVFAGMGSWNDLGFEGEDQDRYSSLSGSLFDLLNEGIVSATNSTASKTKNGSN